MSDASDWSRVGSDREAPPTPWRAECPRRQYGAAPASDGRGRRESVCSGRRGGGRDSRALGRQVEAGVQSSTGRSKPRVV